MTYGIAVLVFILCLVWLVKVPGERPTGTLRDWEPGDDGGYWL